MESILGRFHHGIFHNNRFHCEPRIDRGLLSFPSHKSGAQLHSPHRMMHTLLAKSTVSFSPGGLSHARTRKVSATRRTRKSQYACQATPTWTGTMSISACCCQAMGTSSTDTQHRHRHRAQTQTPEHRQRAQTHKQNPPNTDRYPSKDSEYIHPSKTSKRPDAKHPIESRPA